MSIHSIVFSLLVHLVTTSTATYLVVKAEAI
jgi:hypothetical protein